MKKLSNFPNIGIRLEGKLHSIGIDSIQALKDIGSEKAIVKIATLENSGACLNMLYALEGAIQEIRWHDLSDERKQELKAYYRMI